MSWDEVVIVVDLRCANAHRFEGWFASSETFAQQREQQMVTCPICGSHEVQRQPSAPHVARSAAPAAPAAPADPASILAKLVEVLQDQGIASEDVGERFVEEARKIHYGDAEERAIRGQASLTDALGLLEEGISVLPLPPAKEHLH